MSSQRQFRNFATRHKDGIALVDVLCVGALLVLVAVVGIPTLDRARELSKRTVCSVNLKALGVTGTSYAEANQGQWMTPPFWQHWADTQGGIDYLCHGSGSFDLACVGFYRHRESRSSTVMDPAAGSTAVTTTRAYWMLVRSGDISPKQFICPSSLDNEDPTVNLTLYYDFSDYGNISYGYLVPFGPPDTRPRANADNRVVFAADKGPYYLNFNLDPMTGGPNDTPLQLDSAPKWWGRFGSANHHGSGSYRMGEGQNALYADGRVVFSRRPTAGADNDNIYTLMGIYGTIGFNVIYGFSPHQSPATNPFPGKEAFGRNYSTTDSLIYP